MLVFLRKFSSFMHPMAMLRNLIGFRGCRFPLQPVSLKCGGPQTEGCCLVQRLDHVAQPQSFPVEKYATDMAPISTNHSLGAITLATKCVAVNQTCPLIFCSQTMSKKLF